MTQYTFALALLAAFGFSVGHATTGVDFSDLDLDVAQNQQPANSAKNNANASQPASNASTPASMLSPDSSSSSFADELPPIPGDFEIKQKSEVKNSNLNNVPANGTVGRSASVQSFVDLSDSNAAATSDAAVASNAAAASEFDMNPASASQDPMNALTPDLFDVPAGLPDVPAAAH